MRTLLIFAVIALVVVGVYFFIISRVEKVTFEVKFSNLDVSMLSMQSIINGQAMVKVGVEAQITNRNNFGISLSDFTIMMYYMNTLIAQSADTAGNLQKVLVPANGMTSVLHDVYVILSPASLAMLKDFKDGKQVTINYTTRFSIYFLPYTYRGSFSFKR